MIPPITKEQLEERRLKQYAELIEFWKTQNNKFTSESCPEPPIVKPDDYVNVIIPAFIRCGAIPKNELIVGRTYKGSCRNASEAVWLGDKFEYQRYKFGDTFPEKINHFEDDNGFDLFIPLELV